MSYCATVGASAANSNLIKKIIFTPVLNKSYLHCDFPKCFIAYLENAKEFKLFVCCCSWFLKWIVNVWTNVSSGPSKDVKC